MANVNKAKENAYLINPKSSYWFLYVQKVVAKIKFHCTYINFV